MINSVRMEQKKGAKIANQQLQRRSCWSVCRHRRAELRVQGGDTLHSADTLEKKCVVKVYVH